MFWDGGHLYVYFTYGMHFCANVVTGNAGTGEAVLIRAVEPLVGTDLMRKNRRMDRLHLKGVLELRNLTNGPAKVCQAFDIARKENGSDLVLGEIILINQERIPESCISRSARIGIRSGLEKQWRFFIKGNHWVSGTR